MQNDNLRMVQVRDQVIIANLVSGAWAKINSVHDNVTCSTAIDFIEEYITDESQKHELLRLMQHDENVKRGSTVHFILTDKCNLNCRTCCFDAKPTKNKQIANEGLKQYLKKITDANPSNLILTGGEPLLIKNLPELLQFARANYDGFITLQTNGTLMDDNLAKVIKDTVDSVEISLDGASEETVAPIRGKGVFAKSIRAIELLKEQSFENIVTSCVFIAKDPKLIEAYVRLNKDLGTRYMFRAFEPIGRGAKYADELRKSFVKGEANYESAKRTSSENLALRKTLRARLACGAASGMLGVTFDGYIYACPNLLEEKFRIGHLSDLSIAALEQARGYDRIRSIFDREKHQSCKDCGIRYFCGVCLGGTDSAFQRDCDSQKIGISSFLWD